MELKNFGANGYTAKISKEEKLQNLNLSLRGLVDEYPQNRYWKTRLASFLRAHPEFSSGNPESEEGKAILADAMMISERDMINSLRDRAKNKIGAFMDNGFAHSAEVHRAEQLLYPIAFARSPQAYQDELAADWDLQQSALLETI